MPFKKGQSGNPGGKAKVMADGRTLTDLAREHTPEAVETLVRIATTGESEAAQVSRLPRYSIAAGAVRGRISVSR